MVRRSFFQGLRRRGAAFGAVLAYALLLNALMAAVFDVQAVAAALDPLSAAATCDAPASKSTGNPVQHKNQHQPDCTLCSPACPMGAMVLAPGGGIAVNATPSSDFALRVGASAKSSNHPTSVYRSDADAQAPPAIG
jgi:hypothetical protein